MNWDIAAGNWQQFKGTVRARWGKLTDENLDFIVGRRDQLLGKLQEAYGIDKADAERELEAFEERNRNYHPR